MASSHPPITEKPPSLWPPPRRHAFLSPLPPFCSAGASVSSSAAVFCNSIISTLMFCVRSIDLPLHVTQQSKRPTVSLLSNNYITINLFFLCIRQCKRVTLWYLSRAVSSTQLSPAAWRSTREKASTGLSFIMLLCCCKVSVVYC